MKLLLGALAAAVVASALFAVSAEARPAESRCWRHGLQWHCGHFNQHNRYRLPDPSWGY